MTPSNFPKVAAVAVTSLVFMTQAASAADVVDAAKPLVCAATEVIGCPETGTCVQGPAGLFNLPVLLRVNVKDKVVESTREGGERRTSPILRAEENEGAMVLQGSEGSAVWISTVQKASGRMTVTVAKEGEAYVIFGACMAL